MNMKVNIKMEKDIVMELIFGKMKNLKEK